MGDTEKMRIFVVIYVVAASKFVGGRFEDTSASTRDEQRGEIEQITSKPPREHKTSRSLVPTKNYSDLDWIGALREPPLNVWKFKSRWNHLLDLGASKKVLYDGFHLGDSRRLRNVVRKALRGETLQIIVIGGSNSAGGGIVRDEETLEGLYYNIFTDWWNRSIGPNTGAFMRKRVLAIGGTGSYFFAFCYRTFIPRSDEILDIVLVEESVNFNTMGKAEPLEQLTRQLLSHPSKPAVIFVNVVSGLGKDPSTGKIINPGCQNLEDHGQTELERHYKITSIRLRDIVCPVSKAGKRRITQTNMATSDGRHIGSKAHAQIALLLINHARDVLSDVISGRPEIDWQIPKIPSPIFVKVPVVTPLCWTLLTPNYSQEIFHSTLDVDVLRKSGFRLTLIKKDDSFLRMDAYGGWVAWNSGNSIVFRTSIPHSSELRSVILLTSTSSHGGKANVWLDDNIDKQIGIDTKSVYGQNQLYTVATRVTQGYHSVTVKLVRGGSFLVSGLLVGPSDFDRRNVL